MKIIKKYYVNFSRLFSLMGSEKKKYIIGSIMNTANIAVSFVIPFILSEFVLIVQSEFASAQIHKIVMLCVILLFAIPIASIGNYLKQAAAIYGTAKIRKNLLYHIENSSIRQVHDLTLENCITYITSDVENICRMLKGFGMANLFRFFILYIPAFLVLLFKDWRMALLGVILNIITVIASTFLNPRVRFHERAAQESLADSAGVLMEAVRGASLVRIFSMEDTLKDKYNDRCKGIYKNRSKFIRFNGLVSSITFVFLNSSKLLGFLFGLYLVFSGRMELANVVLTSGLIGIMADGLNSLTNFIKFIQNGLVSSDRVFEVLDMPLEEEKVTEELPDLNYSKAIRFKDVKFSYNSNNKVLNSLSLKIDRGDVVAIVGSSGGGKSTIIRLLQALYETDSGEIFLFDKPYSKLKNRDIRNMFAYVPQENILFQGTIRENISFGNTDSSLDQIIEACKRANIHDFIMSLPDGYDSMIGEDSKNISGGERQRMALARAFLKDAPILLLDEPTSSIDAKSEELVLESISSLSEDKTVLIITHRLSAIKIADSILIIEDGKLVEEGTHLELLDRNGRYRELYQTGIPLVN
ncbi:ABC transporter ATP-binding protein [Xylanivirga thermophila]|uniref:ABC transporter ATP-binding protein n=1 Tax=Xylanivirga thermophila TaxID=2496273 RepID=UPI00101C0F96|nr:ABC transporter ATP-binding protein [Xylanivirga thermophila]